MPRLTAVHNTLGRIIVSELDDPDWVTVHAPLVAGAASPLTCTDPICGGDLYAKERRATGLRHFAHRPNSGHEGCDSGGTSFRHIAIQKAVLAAIKAIGGEWQADMEVYGPGYRADVMATSADRRVVFEVQHSPLHRAKADERTRRMYADGIDTVMWLDLANNLGRSLPAVPLEPVSDRIDNPAWEVQPHAWRALWHEPARDGRWVHARRGEHHLLGTTVAAVLSGELTWDGAWWTTDWWRREQVRRREVEEDRLREEARAAKERAQRELEREVNRERERLKRDPHHRVSGWVVHLLQDEIHEAEQIRAKAKAEYDRKAKELYERGGYTVDGFRIDREDPAAEERKQREPEQTPAWMPTYVKTRHAADPTLVDRILAVLADLPSTPEPPPTAFTTPSWSRCDRCERVVFVFRDGSKHCSLCDPPLPPMQRRVPRR